MLSELDGNKVVGLRSPGLLVLFNMFREEFLSQNNSTFIILRKEFRVKLFERVSNLSRDSELAPNTTYFVKTSIDFSETGMIFSQKIFVEGMESCPIVSCRSVIVLLNSGHRSTRITEELKSRFD